jgi:hypothetical protein
MCLPLFKKIADKVKDVGWSGVPTVIRNQTYDLFHTLYINCVLNLPWVSGKFPAFKQPTVLMIAFPRSGSTWISNLLGLSPDAAFLWEPVTIPFLAKTDKHFYKPHIEDSDFQLFSYLADRAFQGKPYWNCHRSIARVSEFWFTNRKKLQLLIKEINPRATRFYVERYNPKLILLLRHPAAVADSHERLGFLSSLQEFEDFGFHYGEVLSEAVSCLVQENSIVVQFENFAEDPKSEFLRLFSWLGFRPPGDFESIIMEFCNNPIDVTFPGQLKRLSSAEKNKWRKRLSPEKIEALMTGFFRSSLQYYRDEPWI